MKKTLFTIWLISLLTLTACHGVKRVSFEVFKSEAQSVVLKAPKVVSATYNGTYGDQRLSFSSNPNGGWSNSTEMMLFLEFSFLDSVKAMYTYMDQNTSEFYTGLGFRVVNNGTTYEYTSKGFLARIKGVALGKTLNFSISHKFQ